MELAVKTSMKLKWFSVHPNIYNDYLFRKLEENGINLEVYFFKGLKDSHPWKTKMAEGFTSTNLNFGIGGIDWGVIKQGFKASKDELFLVSGWNNRTFFLLQTILAILGKKYCLWSDTPNVDSKRSFVKSVLRSRWIQFVSNRAYKFLITGEAGFQAALKMKIKEEKLVRFPFATNIDFFNPGNRYDNTSNAETIHFISSGRLDNGHKGHHLAIQALADLQKEGFDNFDYRIAGEGEDRAMLTELIESNGLKEKVHLIGWMEPGELPDFYRSADVLLHTSFFDPFPNAIMEAMACGTPVIGSDKAGSVFDRVVNGENGFIHKVGNLEDITQQIRKVFSDRGQLLQMSKNARKTAEKWRVTYNIEVINNLLQNQMTHKQNTNSTYERNTLQ